MTNNLIYRGKRKRLTIPPPRFFMVLAPAHHAVDVEHALLVISEPSNDSVQFPATHNDQWTSQTRFDPCGQLQKTIHSQQAHLNNRRFLVIDGLYRAEFDTKILNTQVHKATR